MISFIDYRAKMTLLENKLVIELVYPSKDIARQAAEELVKAWEDDEEVHIDLRRAAR